MQHTLDTAIEAVLFYKTEPVSKATLISLLDTTEEELERALELLRARLAGGATRIIETGQDVQLATAPDVAPLIERLRADELSRDIGKAGAETLAIILYRGPLARSEIDFIRGVNSSFILRNLQIRGLIERIPHPTLARSFQYRATPDLLAHLGITKREDLPGYAAIMDEIDAYERAQSGASKQESQPASPA